MSGATHCLSCGKEIARPRGPGRPAEYCGAACRKRRHRQRWGELGKTLSGRQLLGAIVELSDDELGLSANDQEAALEVIHEAFLLVAKFDRLAARGGHFAWRFARLETALRTALDLHWTGPDGG